MRITVYNLILLKMRNDPDKSYTSRDITPLIRNGESRSSIYAKMKNMAEKGYLEKIEGHEKYLTSFRLTKGRTDNYPEVPGMRKVDI